MRFYFLRTTENMMPANARPTRESTMIFVFFDGVGSPTQAWTRVLRVGKVEGKILPASKTLIRPLGETLSAQNKNLARQK